MGEWISVNDRFPSKDGDYLCFLESGHISVGYFSPTFWVKDFSIEAEGQGMATHWMPLPEPPKDGD